MTRPSTIKFLGLIVLLLLLAIYFRWISFPFVQIYSDALSPFVGGIQFFELGFAKPPNPESDHWLWVSTLPLLSLASSIEELFWLRYLANVIIIPVATLSIYILLSESKWRFLGVGVVGSLLAVDSGLIDTLISSFRGYFAPEYLSFAALGVALYQKEKRVGFWLAIVSSVLAGGQHPLAMGSFLGLAFLGVFVWRESKRDFGIGVLLFFLCLIPRIFWIWQLMQCDAGGFACLTDIAMSSSEQTSQFHQIYRVFHDRFWIEMGLGGLFLLLGLWFSRRAIFTQWVFFSMLGILILGLSISTLRPYHFRILAVPMVIASVFGWIQYLKTFVIVLPVWMLFLILFPPNPVAWKNNIRIHDQLAEVLCQIPDSFWIEGYETDDLNISLQALAISYWIKDCDRTKIAPQAGDLIFVLGREGLPYPKYFSQQDIVLYQLPSIRDMENLNSEKRVSGYDFVVLFVPEAEIILH